MESVLFRILGILEASPADWLIFVMGVFVAIVLTWAIRRMNALSNEVKQLDKLVLLQSFIISQKLGIKTVKVHRNNDYEIEQPINVVE